MRQMSASATGRAFLFTVIQSKDDFLGFAVPSCGEGGSNFESSTAEGPAAAGGRTLGTAAGTLRPNRRVMLDQQSPTLVWDPTMLAETQPISAFGASTMNHRLVPSYHCESSQHSICTCSPLVTLRPKGLLQVELV